MTKAKPPRFKVMVIEEADAWRVDGPVLKAAARKLSRPALNALLALGAPPEAAAFLALDLPPEAAAFLFDVLFAWGLRGHRPRKDIYNRFREEYEAAPAGQKQAVILKFERAGGPKAATLIRKMRRQRKADL